jgi:REP element-mobilizing transposase RayT
MGRPHRDLVAGGYYHVGSRGNNHAPIVVDREDRMVFFHLLRRVERRYGWRIHVSCLMGNHYHLVLETRPQPGQGNARPERRLRPRLQRAARA